MAQPALDVLHALDSALAAAVATASPAIVQIRRGHRGGTGIAWPTGTTGKTDLVITSSFHTPDKTIVGIPQSDGSLEKRKAEVIGRDPGTDVALLRVAGGGLIPATLRTELDGLAVGNLALAIGRPGQSARASLRAIGVLGPEIRTPFGGRLERYVESDRQIPRGFAGGPLIDADGAVIGMNTRTLLRGADLAVPVMTLTRVIDELQQHGGVRRGYLGVGTYPVEGGAVVANVEAGGPAANAGLLVGDVIVEAASEPISGPDGLRRVLGDRPGASIRIGILRGGARVDLDVTLASKP
jgi:S1-C subfamily serine protease